MLIRYVSLATYRRNGVAVNTPVCIAKVAERYYVFSAGDAGKVKRIRSTPRVRLAACDVRGNVRSAWIGGRIDRLGPPDQGHDETQRTRHTDTGR